MKKHTGISIFKMEQDFLASLLISKNFSAFAEKEITIKYFIYLEHQIIFSAIKKLLNNNEIVDILSVIEILRENKMLPKIGGEIYLFDIIKNFNSNFIFFKVSAK